MKSGIYKITSPIGKVYIGQSIDIGSRIKKYKNLNCKKQIKLYLSLKKYGVSTHIFEIVEICDIEKLNEKERFYQDKYISYKNGLNCRITGTDEKSGHITNEAKNKISVFNKGKIISENVRLKMSKSKIGKQSHRKGKKMSETTKAKMSASQKKSILQFTLDGILIERFDSALTASINLNLIATHIRACCRGKRKSSGGFKWSYDNLQCPK